MLKINGIEFEENEYLYSNDEDGKKVTLEHIAYGERNSLLISNIFSSKEILIEVNEEKFDGEISSSSKSYTGDLNDETEVKLRYTIVEAKEKPLSETDKIFVKLVNIGISNWARTRAISELLIDKEIFTEEQYISKIEEVRKRDMDEFIAVFKDGFE